MLAVTSSRVIRYFGLALLVYYFGDETEKMIRKYKLQAVVGGIAVILLIFGLRHLLAN
jgi:hypothetical protein